MKAHQLSKLLKSTECDESYSWCYCSRDARKPDSALPFEGKRRSSRWCLSADGPLAAVLHRAQSWSMVGYPLYLQVREQPLGGSCDGGMHGPQQVDSQSLPSWQSGRL